MGRSAPHIYVIGPIEYISAMHAVCGSQIVSNAMQTETLGFTLPVVCICSVHAMDMFDDSAACLQVCKSL